MEVSDVPQKSSFVRSEERDPIHMGIAYIAPLGQMMTIPSGGNVDLHIDLTSKIQKFKKKNGNWKERRK